MLMVHVFHHPSNDPRIGNLICFIFIACQMHDIIFSRHIRCNKHVKEVEQADLFQIRERYFFRAKREKSRVMYRWQLEVDHVILNDAIEWKPLPLCALQHTDDLARMIVLEARQKNRFRTLYIVSRVNDILMYSIQCVSSGDDMHLFVLK